MNPSRGFTLVEVLVAVAILAIAMAAILSGMARYADNAAYLRDKTLALWVAHNRIANLMSQPEWPSVGRSNGNDEMGGDDWRWTAEVKETPDDRLRRIDVTVAHDQKPEATLATVSAFRRRPAGSGS